MGKYETQLLNGKNCLVLGLAKSGYGVAKILQRIGANVMVNELKNRADCSGIDSLESVGIRVVCGGHPLSLLDEDIWMIIKNPGIPYDIPFLQEAERRNIPVVTEVEIAYMISKAPIIGITGSNGKTTTTTIIYEMLKGGEKEPLIAGNIGTVFSEVAEKAMPEQWIVSELSSFQLLGTKTFQPEIGLLLNIYDAHLDYHHTKEHYIASKAKLFANQTSAQKCVLNYDDLITRQMADRVTSQIVWFSIEHELTRGTFIKDQNIIHKDRDGQETIVCHVQDVNVPGRHNLINMLAAISVSVEAGAQFSRIREVIKSFDGVPHRLQFVRELDGVKYYNDSKATNLLATEKGVQSFTQPVVLIAGGLDRGDDYAPLEPLLAERVKGIVVYGQIAHKLMKAAQNAGLKHIIHVDTVDIAVRSAHQLASQGDVVLLSPAAASWDQFRTFEERGDMFTGSVHML